MKKFHWPVKKRQVLYWLLPITCGLLILGGIGINKSVFHASAAPAAGLAEQAFTQASQATGVPVELLKAVCQMEGQLSMHKGAPSVSDGYGCMNIVHTSSTDGCQALQENSGETCTHHFVRPQVDTLGQASHLSNLTTEQIKHDFASNILAGAWILHADALSSSPTHTLPTTLSGWYTATSAYSNATISSTATIYADAVFKLLQTGFSGVTDQGETVTLLPQSATPQPVTASVVKSAATLPLGCQTGGADYAPAINCIIDPATDDCNTVANNLPCNYESANRPQDLAITHIVIHDVEGSAQAALSTFQDPNNAVTAHYIVDTDGTIYEVLHNKDIGYHAGNYWYNQHAIGIEHAGFDQDGYRWYNATQYLASANLVAYLIKQYNIPLDHDHIVSHGTIPSSRLAVAPNHVDPGPYWLWQYYINLIGPRFFPAALKPISGTVTLLPSSGRKPYGPHGTETTGNFNFFSLYSGPSTASALIPHSGDATDITDETTNVETEISYYYTHKQVDQAGTGDTMYEIWYGEEDQPGAAYPQNHYAHAQQAWLAVPKGVAVESQCAGNPVVLQGSGSVIPVYGRPATQSAGYANYQLGEAPAGAIFISAYTASITEDDGTQTLWYEINYNHRQAWVLASNIASVLK